jgi:polar amino acid transport system substrate-binding protein
MPSGKPPGDQPWQDIMRTITGNQAIKVWKAPWLALAMLALMQTATAQGAEIEYGSPDQSIWTNKLDERGELDNPLLSLADALFAKANMPWHGKSYPATRLFKYLQDGTSPFSMLVKVPALQACCLWSKKPVATAEIRAYHLADKAPVKTLEELAGKNIITIRGYSYGALRSFIDDEKNRIRNSESPNHAAAFRMLASGRADYLIDYAGPAAEVMINETQARIHSDLLLRQDVYMVLSKSYPDAVKVMQRLEKIASSLDIPGILKAHEKQGVLAQAHHTGH